MELLDESIIRPLTTFAKNSKMLVQQCEKPDYNEFMTTGTATLMGFAVMGMLGFFVKVIFIPINNVILGA